MCLSAFLQVVSLTPNHAIMSDGRKVKLVLPEKIKVGDYLEVLADLAIAKIDKQELNSIQKARQAI
jgi:hydrogenase maturation factor